ncbi:putative signal peptide-containing protein [Cryptosporidium canis]|uniref:Signal peptide-containing protein n=1 Tax=Cryptosporidium canis TaxID=195482 RepID=A0ABQ8P6G0_9CRYT|nr:putative signal peptide-containing protein [Cryptosporidium canis]
MRSPFALFACRVVLLLVAHAVFGGECQGLGIYSTLPDHIVDWLKRHILVEISQVGCHLADGRTEDLAEGGRRCSSVTGPYCRHLSRVSAVSGHDLETANYIYDHEGGTGCFNRDFFLGKSAYGLFGASENATTHPESTEAVESFRSASRARLHDTAAMQRYCKLTRGNFLYCFKLILRSYYESLTRGLAQAGLVSRLLSSWRAFLRAAQDFRYLKGGSRRRRSASRASWRKNEIFTVVHDFALPPLHPDYLGREGERAPSPEASSPYRKDVYFQVRSNFLFDETLSSFLRSRYVRMNLVSGLTWILQQTTPYLGIWRNKRAERLSRHYILADHPETHSCGGFSVSPYNGLKVCSDLLLGDFQSKFRVIRRAWNGVSSMMSFSGLRPNVRILPAEFSSDAQLTCEWEGLWEVHQDRTLAIRLLSRFGKLRVTNEKMVVSRLPVSISNMSPDKTSMDDAKVVTISGYSHSRLMWRSAIPLSSFQSESGTGDKWLNALDFSDTIPYSLVDIIQFEADFLMESTDQKLLLGPFEYHLLNPALSYTPKNEDKYRELNVEIDSTAELSLVIKMDDRSPGEERDQAISSVSMTTMHASKASPLVSIHDIESRGCHLKGRVSESTLCVIKKNMADRTKDQ